MLTFKHNSPFWMFALVGAGTIALSGSWQPEAQAQTVSASPLAPGLGPVGSADPAKDPAKDPANQIWTIVSPAAGNDATADGSDRAPFKTITRALQMAQPNTIVLLSPGLYSAETGEVFPLILKPGVTLYGNPQTRGQGIVIRGGGAFLSKTSARQNVTILAANQAALVGVTVSNPDNAGYGLWVESTRPIVTDNTFTASGHDGISVVGDGAPLIRNNYFYQNGANGITIYGRSRPEVRENIFENTGFGITVNQFAAPTIDGNRITQNKDGVVVGANARPVLRHNSIESNTRDGLVAIANAQPDLGTPTDLGGNIFRNNGQLDINAQQTNQVILAVGNEITKIQGQLDLTGTGSPPVASRPIAAPPALLSMRFSTQAIVPAAAIPDPPQAPVAIASDVSANSFPVPADLNPVDANPVLTASAPNLPAQGGNAPLPSLLPAPRIFPAPIALRPVGTAIAIPVPPPESRSAGSARATGSTRSTGSSVSAGSTALTGSTGSPRPLLLVTRSQTLTPAVPQAPQPLPPVQPTLLMPRPQAAIAIPVPPPESRSVAQVTPIAPIATPAARSGPPSALSSAAAETALLPVPSAPIPIGNIGSGSGIPLYQSASRRSALAASLPYRVVVDARDAQQQKKAQTLIPGAFRTNLNGKMVMQLGAFSDRAKANELVQALRGQGVQAAIEVE